MSQPQAFATADIGQAAFLMVTGHKFLGIERSGRERVAFRFSDTPQKTADESALGFANNAPAPAKSLMESLRFLKGILRDARATAPKNKVQSRGIRNDRDREI